MTSYPSIVGDPFGLHSRPGRFGFGDDPARLLVQLSRYERPRLSVPGGIFFVWPLGIEGANVTGAAVIAEHKYIGDNAPVLEVTHRDDKRITLEGMFPGLTGIDNVQALEAVIEAPTPPGGKVLTLPGMFPKEQKVVIESYNFIHDQEDRTNSWTYSIVFRKTGVGDRLQRQATGNVPPTGQQNSQQNRGKSDRIFIVRDGARTLRAISGIVYKDPDKWRNIYNKNVAKLSNLAPLHEIATKLLPLGMGLEY